MGYHNINLFEQCESLSIRELAVRADIIKCLDFFTFEVIREYREEFIEALKNYREIVSELRKELKVRLERLEEIAANQWPDPKEPPLQDKPPFDDLDIAIDNLTPLK